MGSFEKQIGNRVRDSLRMSGRGYDPKAGEPHSHFHGFSGFPFIIVCHMNIYGYELSIAHIFYDKVLKRARFRI